MAGPRTIPDLDEMKMETAIHATVLRNISAAQDTLKTLQESQGGEFGNSGGANSVQQRRMQRKEIQQAIHELARTATEIPPEPDPRNATKDSPFFTILPPEIRQLIYRKLLCGCENLLAGILVKTRVQCVVSVKDRKDQRWNTDSIVLRVCRRIYHEALPILYRENDFLFFGLEDLRDFRSLGLATVTCEFHRNCKIIKEC